MMRLGGLCAIVAAVGLMLAGCPTGGGGGGGGGGDNLPPGDPDPLANALLTLNSTVSILQRNASGATNPAFERSSLLTATLVNVSDPGAFTITWQITPLGNAGFLSFASNDGTAVLTATGPQATVFAVNSPLTAARYRVDALAASSETSLSSTLQIEVQPDPISAAGDSTVLSVNPFADPPVGVNDVNQVTLLAGDSGPLTRTAFLWEAIDPGSIPAGLVLPEVVDRDNSTLVLTVAGDVTGVFPFRVSVTDSIGNIQTGVVNVYLGITELTLDAQVKQILTVSSAVTLQTVRAGGASDITSGTDDSFTYTWQAFDAVGAPVAVTVLPESAVVDTNPATLDANLIDWRINGLSAPGVFRLDCTVVDRVGNATTSSVVVSVTDDLSLTVGSTRTQVGSGTPFSLRTIRSGGSAGFTYSFLALDSSGADVTAGTGLTTTPSNNVTSTWPVGGGLSPDVYQFFVSVRDGDETLATASTMVEVISDLSVSVEPVVTEIGTLQPFTIRTARLGGRADFDYSFTVVDSGGAVMAAGTTGLADATNNGAAIVWNVNGLPADTYRIFVSVTDGEGRQSLGSTSVLVGDVLSLNLVADTPIVAPGVPVRFRAQARGGSGSYNFAFTGFDAEGDVVGTFSAITIVGNTGIATFVTNASDSAGGYRIRATVSDSRAHTAGAVASLFVTHDPDQMASARILNPPAAQLDLVSAVGVFEPGVDFDAIGNLPDDFVHFVPSTLDPAIQFARNLTLRISDNGAAGLAVASITFIGVNQRGEVVTDQIISPAINTNVTTMTTPFKRLDRVTVAYTGAENVDTIEIGIGDRFGLARPFATVNEAAADRSFVIVATGTDLTANPQNAAFIDPVTGTFETVFFTAGPAPAPPPDRFPDRQSIRFPGLVPDGVNDYIVQFVPLNSMHVGVNADDLLLDVSDGDVANVGISVFGGVPPYRIDYSDLGSRTADNTINDDFNPASPQSLLFTGTIVRFTPPPVLNPETHTIRVSITDAVGDAAVGFLTINVTP